MIKVKNENMKQLILNLNQDLYSIILERAKIKKITVLAEIRNLLTTGISVETKNDDISYLVKKVDSYDDRIAKILNTIKLNYDLTVQEFCNKGYAANKKPSQDHAYQDFWKNRRKNNMDD
jgi:hypothetical protein